MTGFMLQVFYPLKLNRQSKFDRLYRLTKLL